MKRQRHDSYRSRAAAASENPRLQKMLQRLQTLLGQGAARAFAELPDGENLRRRGHAYREQSIARLDQLLADLAAAVRARGGQVFFARDAADANRYCVEIARKNRVRRAVKGKSMLAEEIGLNQALEGAGIEVTETDLGEYIVQLAGEHPFHIIAPAIHKSRQDVGRLFSEKLGIDYSDDPATLTLATRRALREKFLTADMGITGCNLACAESGRITVLSNEGNIRLATSLPRIHIALMGMERITTSLKELQLLLGLLCQGASAQKIATYVSHIGGPAAAGDGPEEFHLVIVDHGRSRILSDRRFREMLYCLRCGACLNACLVYRKIGGFAYDSPYSGPMGAVISPLLFGFDRYQDLCKGESLCGACKDACPIHIDIPRMLLELRHIDAVGDQRWQVRRGLGAERIFYGFWSRLITRPDLYEIFRRISAFGCRIMAGKSGTISRLPWPLNGWTSSRELKAAAKKSFTARRRRQKRG